MIERCVLMVILLGGIGTVRANDSTSIDDTVHELNYALTDKGQRFIDEMSGQYDYSREELQALFEQITPDEVILTKIARPAEKSMPWYKYKRIFSDTKRLQNGVKFYRRHRQTLDEAYQQYGVEPTIIVAILGVETRYGKITGNDQVLRALTTIAFDYPRRERFFTKELRAFLQMCKQENINPLHPKGSYAGAMGMAQFMPSSFLNYAVDYDGDGKRDLWHNPGDAIFSIANYLAAHGWQRDQLISARAALTQPYQGRSNHKPFTHMEDLKAQGIFAQQATVADNSRVGLLSLTGENGELWFITLPNFAVITTYNTSPMYAMAVQYLAQAIEAQL